MMYTLKKMLKSILPKEAVSAYHLILAAIGAVWYRFPSRYITVIGVTGTKGKSSTTEYIHAILTEAGCRSMLSNSIRRVVGGKTHPQPGRMSMPGRFALQKMLREAVDKGCTHAVIEMTSEGAVQSRQRFISMDALVFTNLAPEHIESHGSLEKYQEAKLAIGKTLSRSRKRPRILVVNKDDPFSAAFLSLPHDKAISFSLTNAEPYDTSSTDGHCMFQGTQLAVHHPGEFSLMNALAAAHVTHALGMSTAHIAQGIASLTIIPGRAERIELGQPFTVVVDYAHNPSSLEALYTAYPNTRKICVLGSTGGGRDRWKRPHMGVLADTYCDTVILTNEDPYDEDPLTIIEALKSEMHREPIIEVDRRLAIRAALRAARDGDTVLITGKGIDPTIQERHGTATMWSDRVVAEEELRALIDSRTRA